MLLLLGSYEEVIRIVMQFKLLAMSAFIMNMYC